MGNLVFWALNKDVAVEADGLKIRGHLISVQEASRGRDHKPMVLVLVNRLGQAVLVRGWDLIIFKGDS